MREEHLIREFIAEAEDHLSTFEPNLLRLEKEPTNSELINELFLATHSIKGTASYVGLGHISQFTHALESLLDALRKGQLQAAPDLVDVLLDGVDTLKLLIQHVSLGKPAPDTSGTLERLAAWQARQPNIAPVSVSPLPPAAPPRPVGKPRFDPQGFQLEREDCEIFADITGQQLEFIRFSIAKLREWLKSAEPCAPEQLSNTFEAMLKAMRKVQSSAAMLAVADLDALLAGYQQAFAHIAATLPVDVGEIEPLEVILAELTEIVATMTAYSQAAGTPPAEPPALPEPALALTPAVELLQGRSMLRVDAERVDQLLNLVGELVIHRARLVEIGHELKTLYEDARTADPLINPLFTVPPKKQVRFLKNLKDQFEEIVSDVGRITNQMQEGTMRIRMLPISHVLSRFPRMLRDLARQAHKEVEIRIEGAETELDKTVIDYLTDPLIHLLRNAIDHGIEAPTERLQRGKPRQGLIALTAYHEGNQVMIEIQDDGRGIDGQLVRQKALEQHLLTPQEAAALSYRELIQLIFHNGFSTVESVSSLSGRGVGLNVVKRYLEKISGALEMESTPGSGCLFTIKLPLTLAIIPALMVRVQHDIFAIPLIAVEEAIRIAPADIKTIESHQMVPLRERMIPLVDLAELFGFTGLVPQAPEALDSSAAERPDEANEQGFLYGVIISDGACEAGLLVDAFLGESDIVMKPLHEDFINVPGISGASIRGDGRVALVLDAASLIQLMIQHIRQQHQTRTLQNLTSTSLRV